MKSTELYEKNVFNHRVLAGVMVGGCALATAVFVHLGRRGPGEPNPSSIATGASPAQAGTLEMGRDPASWSASARGRGETGTSAVDPHAAGASRSHLGSGSASSSSAEVADAESERPEVVLAIAHEDSLTDFREEAAVAILNGSLDAAMTALRKHVYRAEADVELLIELGRIAAELKSYAIAEKALTEAALLDPLDGEIAADLARVYLSTKNLEDADRAARRAVSLAPESVGAWNVTGRVAMSVSQWQRAEFALRRAVALDPTNAMLHNNLGLLYIFMRDGDQAVDSLETSVQLFDEEPPAFALNNLGLAHELAKNHEDARHAFEWALRVEPMYTKARLNLARIERAAVEERPVAPGADPSTVDLNTIGEIGALGAREATGGSVARPERSSAEEAEPQSALEGATPELDCGCLWTDDLDEGYESSARDLGLSMGDAHDGSKRIDELETIGEPYWFDDDLPLALDVDLMTRLRLADSEADGPSS